MLRVLTNRDEASASSCFPLDMPKRVLVIC